MIGFGDLICLFACELSVLSITHVCALNNIVLLVIEIMKDTASSCVYALQVKYYY